MTTNPAPVGESARGRDRWWVSRDNGDEGWFAGSTMGEAVDAFVAEHASGGVISARVDRPMAPLTNDERQAERIIKAWNTEPWRCNLDPTQQAVMARLAASVSAAEP